MTHPAHRRSPPPHPRAASAARHLWRDRYAITPTTGPDLWLCTRCYRLAANAGLLSPVTVTHYEADGSMWTEVAP